MRPPFGMAALRLAMTPAHIGGGLPFHGVGKTIPPVQSTEAVMAKKRARKKFTSPESKPTTESDSEIPVGFTLRHTLRGNGGIINRIAWSPDGRRLASPSTTYTCSFKCPLPSTFRRSCARSRQSLRSGFTKPIPMTALSPGKADTRRLRSANRPCRKTAYGKP